LRTERDVPRDVFAHALERARIRVRVTPGLVRMRLTVDLQRVVLRLALPRTGVGSRARHEHSRSHRGQREVPVALDRDEFALVGVGDHGSCEYSLHGHVSSDSVSSVWEGSDVWAYPLGCSEPPAD